MKIVIQRSLKSEVSVNNKIVGKIEKGLVLLVGFHEEDTIIACVGDNGGTTDEDIRNGFKRTVELLTESLKTGSEVEDISYRL